MAETSDRSPSLESLPRLIPQLPDEISIQCIARVPPLLQPTLPLVSRSWHSLLNSPLLFSVRSHLGLSRCFICFSVHQHSTDQSQWYLLDRDPQNPRPLLRLPPPPFPTVGYSCAALGPTIFVIGGRLYGLLSPIVQIFDARVNQWSIGPMMASARASPFVGAIGGRIYAIGGYGIPPSGSWAEVLDPGLGLWSPVPSPTHLREKRIFAGSVYDGKLYMFESLVGGVVFDPESEPAWSFISSKIDLRLQQREVFMFPKKYLGTAMIVDGIHFIYTLEGKIRGYDQTADKWMFLEGLERLDMNQAKFSRLYNVGGILCAIWEPLLKGSVNTMELVFAGIKVSRKNCGGLWGSPVWTKSVVLAEKGSFNGHCIGLEL